MGFFFEISRNFESSRFFEISRNFENFSIFSRMLVFRDFSIIREILDFEISRFIEKFSIFEISRKMSFSDRGCQKWQNCHFWHFCQKWQKVSFWQFIVRNDISVRNDRIVIFWHVCQNDRIVIRDMSLYVTAVTFMMASDMCKSIFCGMSGVYKTTVFYDLSMSRNCSQGLSSEGPWGLSESSLRAFSELSESSLRALRELWESGSIMCNGCPRGVRVSGVCELKRCRGRF